MVKAPGVGRRVRLTGKAVDLEVEGRDHVRGLAHVGPEEQADAVEQAGRGGNSVDHPAVVAQGQVERAEVRILTRIRPGVRLPDRAGPEGKFWAGTSPPRGRAR